MANQDVLIQVKVASDQEARHVQKALQSNKILALKSQGDMTHYLPP
jgi:hypothetical protein